jgi:predicted DNA-binding protein
MAKNPTGRPRGRPPGTGFLGEQTTRYTFRLPSALIDRLEAFAAERTFTRGTPKIAVCVREALEEYLARHNKRQTINIPQSVEHNNRQTENAVEPQPTGPIEPTYDKSQTLILPGEDTPHTEKNKRQTEITLEPFDPTKYVLGDLCIHGHDYHGSGQSLRRKSDKECLECHRERARAYRQRKRQGQPV